MAANQLVQERIDGAIEEKALPFEPLIPNETTIAAMKEARRDDLPRFTSVQALLDYLGGDD